MRKNTSSREVFLYIIIGAITTGINMLVYYVLCNRYGILNLAANAIAWFASVLFAFIGNDQIVFHVKQKEHPISMRIVHFFGARVVSLGLDEAGMFLLVDIMGFNNMISKIMMNVLVILVNYIWSKYFIFQEKKEYNHGN